MAALDTFGSNLWLPLLFTFTFIIQSGAGIKCWECNSHYDPNCGDPFRNSTFALTDCNQRTLDHYPHQKSEVCRKIVQKVRDDYRFVRGCGYLVSESDSTDCFKRAGTFNVLVQYCSCNGDGCNSAPPSTRYSWIGLLAAMVLTYVMLAK